MADNERDVLLSDPSTDNEPTEEEVATPDSEDVTPDPEPEVTPEPETEPEPSPEPAVEEDASVLKERLVKAEEEKQNLLKALQQERRAKQPVVTDAPAPPPAQAAQEIIEVRNTVLQEQEQAAYEIIFKEFPELAPENDVDNSKWTAFRAAFRRAAAVNEIKPKTANQIIGLSREVMGILKGREDAAKAAERARADAHRDQLKAKAANIGGSSSSSPKTPIKLNESDKRAAQVSGLTDDEYAKVKDVYGEPEIPV